MPRRSNRLIFLILTLTAISLYWGCTQPKDVISDVSSSRLTLVAERLPTLPGDMVYELWVGEANGDNISLGKFSYDQVNRKFLETDSTPRGNQFTLEDDLLKQYWDEDDKKWKYWFNKIFVSVENNPDDNGAAPGPIMLQDVVTEPSDDQIELRFQNADTTIGDATVRYNLESVSDGNRWSSSVGQGLWFTSYGEVSKDLPDTLSFSVGFVEYEIGTLELAILYDSANNSVGVDTLNSDEIFKPSPSYVAYAYPETTEITFGPDTVYLDATPLNHIGYRVEIVDSIDSTPPYMGNNLTYTNYDTVSNSVTLDIFSQDEFDLPDYGPDWHYKGWIVSTTAKTTPGATKLSDFITARFSPPAWRYNTPMVDHLPGATGALISTGTFSFVDSVDDGNPYVLDPLLVPLYPGEDFVNTSALFDSFGVAEKFDLLPSGINYGSVFITIEPSNFNANTNFPLIAFGSALPSSKSGVSGTSVTLDMWNWTQTIETDQIGFPQITVDVETF